MVTARTPDPPDEVTALRQRVAELESKEKEYRKTEELLTLLASFPRQNPNPVIEIGLDGTVSYLNPVAWERFPDLVDIGLGHPILEGLESIIQSLREGGQDFILRELEIGDLIYEQRILYVAESHLIRIFAHDITEFKRTEEKLVRLASFPEQNPDPVIETDLEGAVSYLNPIARERFPDLHTVGLGHPILEGLESIIPRLEEGKEVSLVRELEVRDFIYQQKIVYMGESRLIRIYTHDITALKQLQAQIQLSLTELEQTNRQLHEAQVQLVQSEKMAALGKLVAGIAHEINTPIGAIYSVHDTLIRAENKLRSLLGEQDSGEAPDSRRVNAVLQVIADSSKVIRSGSERVMDIVKSMRSFARLDEAELKQVDIHEGLEDTLKLIQHDLEDRIEVVKNYGDVPAIVCYPGPLNQAFLSLLVNAVQAIEGPGQITITTLKEDEKLHVAIQDTGVGIPEEHIDKVFEPGFTTKGVGVGTGLGLSICYQVIQDHNGEIRLESRVGEGTSVTIILPYDLA